MAGAANAKAGHFYRESVEHVNKVLNDPGALCPAYDAKAGYELAGFVWFQGWNDLTDKGAYSRQRQDGMITEEDRTRRPHVVSFRDAQAAPAELPEFNGNVFAVQTGHFYDVELKRLDWKWGKVKSCRNGLKREGKSREEVAAAQREFIAANWTAEELETRKACSAFSFHYLGSAKFFCQAGEAFAKALVHKTSL